MAYAALTKHAKVRLQQRGIPETFVDVLMDFGVAQHIRKGAEVVYLRRKERRMLRSCLAGHELPRHFQNAYLVVSSDGRVITAGHRITRVKHH